MKKSYFISVDPGTRNLAICQFRKTQGEKLMIVQSFQNFDLNKEKKKKFTEFEMVKKILSLVVAPNRDLFNDSEQILLENQMRRKMNIVNTVLQTLYPEKVLMINKTAVHKKLEVTGTGLGVHAQNKKAAIAFVENCADIRFECGTDEWVCKTNHNFADAAMNGYYAVVAEKI
jgi:hypothetical protein